jgi:serine protease Do
MDGDVIGVNTAILSPTGGSIGIGFSMASNVVTKVVDQLIEFGEVRRGWLGVMIQPVTDDIAEAQGLDKAMGALVTDAYGAPAKDAGVMAGDIILKFNGEEVEDTGDLVRRVGDASVGAEVAMTVQRGGDQKELKVVLGQRPSEAELAADRGNGSTPKMPSPEPKTILGLTLVEIDDEKRAEMDLPKDANGLIVTEVAEGSTAEEKGLLAGDIITEAGQVKIATIAEFNDQIEATKEAGRKSMLLMIRRGGAPRFVALKVDE